MGKRLRHYTREFKLEALRLFDESDQSAAEIAEGLGISVQNLYRWRHEFKTNPNSSFSGSGKKQFEDPKDEEIYKLKKQLESVSQERDILKKAIAIFSKEPRLRKGS